MALITLNTGVTANKGIAAPLYHPVDQVPIGIRFFLLGVDSKEYKQCQREWDAYKREKQKRSRGVYVASQDEMEENNLKTLCRMTTGWEEDITNEKGEVIGVRPEIELKDGEFVPFSAEAICNIYKDPGFAWIREQMDAQIGDRKDFLPSVNRN